MSLKELALLFWSLRDRESGVRGLRDEAGRGAGNLASFLLGAEVEMDRNRGGWRVVLGTRASFLVPGSCPADRRNLSATVGAVFSRPDLAGPGQIPGSWRTGSRGQFVNAAVGGFVSEAAAWKNLFLTARDLNPSSEREIALTEQFRASEMAHAENARGQEKKDEKVLEAAVRACFQLDKTRAYPRVLSPDGSIWWLRCGGGWQKNVILREGGDETPPPTE